MYTYHAIGKGQYIDQSQKLLKRVFEAENDNAAYHYIVNHFDCSLAWTFERITPRPKKPSYAAQLQAQNIELAKTVRHLREARGLGFLNF